MTAGFRCFSGSGDGTMTGTSFCMRSINDHLAEPGHVVFRHACALGYEGIVSKRLGSRYVSGRTRDWFKMKNPEAPAVKREAEDWGKEGWKGLIRSRGA
jgi:hypothetical protein